MVKRINPASDRHTDKWREGNDQAIPRPVDGHCPRCSERLRDDRCIQCGYNDWTNARDSDARAETQTIYGPSWW